MSIETSLEPATIAINASLSDAIHLHNMRLFAIQMPAAWDAANLTFQGSADAGTTYYNVYDDNGAEVTIAAAALRFIIFDPARFLGLQRLKIRSGTSGVPVVQTAARSILLVPVA